MQSNFGNMSDSQLRNTITALSTAAANRPDQFRPYSPAPQDGKAKSEPLVVLYIPDYAQLFLKAYGNNLHKWATSSAPNPRGSTSGSRTRSARAAKTSSLGRDSSTPTTRPYTPPTYQAPLPPAMPMSTLPPNPPRAPLPTTTQALHSTYASRLRTGATLLVQPIFPTGAATTTRTATRRGGVVNYVDPGSGDEELDAGALDSDDSDFVASG